MSNPLTIGATSGATRSTATQAVGAVQDSGPAGGAPISRAQRVAATMRLAADLAALPPAGDAPASPAPVAPGRSD